MNSIVSISVSLMMLATVLNPRLMAAEKKVPAKPAVQQESSPQVYVRVTSERQRDVLMKFLKEVSPSKYRLEFEEPGADSKLRKSTRGSLPLKEVRQVRGHSTALKGKTEAAFVHELLKSFFSVAAVDKLKAELKKADNKPHDVKIVGQ